MRRIEAERGALLCAAYFITDYENMLPSIGGEYAADYDAAIDGIPVTLSCTCSHTGKRAGEIEAFRFRVEGVEGGEEVEVKGNYPEACHAAVRFINAYLRLIKN